MKHLLPLLILTALGYSATIVVNDVGDSVANDGKCTLREAIINANNNAQVHQDCSAGNGDDVIVFSPSLNGSTITLTSPLLVNLGGGNLTIDGGRVRITISGGGNVGLFNLTGTGTLELKNLNLVNGRVSSTGNGSLAKLEPGQVLKLSNCFVGYHNAVDGVIYNNGGTVEVVNSTFGQNNAVVFFNNAGTTRVSFITGKDNVGIVFKRITGTLQVKDSIFEHSGTLCEGTVAVSGIVYATRVNGCSGITRKTAQELAIGTLDYHGGSTLSYALEPNSVAINKSQQCTDISGNVITKDQSGKDRNKNGKGCDLGAYEVLFNVNVNVQPSGAGSVFGTGEYEKGADVVLVAVPNPGYEFDKWLGNCNCQSRECTITNISSDKTCTAEFKQIPNAPLPNQATAGNIVLQTNATINSFEIVAVSPPEGYVVKYPAVKMKLQTNTTNAIVRLIYPSLITPNSRIYKVVGNQFIDISSQVFVQGNSITLTIADNSMLDLDPRAGYIEDPIVVLEPKPATNNNPISFGGSGGCNTGSPAGVWTWLLTLALVVVRRMFKGGQA